jgi:predicted nuclease of predicted toxin-antitoxin system
MKPKPPGIASMVHPVKLLLDEHFSDEIAKRLRGLGHDVIAVTAVETQRGIADLEVFEMAQRQGRAVVTRDREDFESLIRACIRTSRSHHGLVIVDSRRLPGREFGRQVAALSALIEGPDLGPSFVVWLRSPPLP